MAHISDGTPLETKLKSSEINNKNIFWGFIFTQK